jgi:uncharacterized damage-inducible protein DinB
MTFDDLQTLLDYHYWARDRMLAVVETLPHGTLTKPLGNSFSSIFDTVVHLYGADWIWCERWHGDTPTTLPPSSTFPDLAALRHAWNEEEQRIRAVLTRLGPADVDHPVQYRAWDGRMYTQPFWQMLQHLVNHVLSSRSGDDDAAAGGGNAAESDGPDRVLSRARYGRHLIEHRPQGPGLRPQGWFSDKASVSKASDLIPLAWPSPDA